MKLSIDGVTYDVLSIVTGEEPGGGHVVCRAYHTDRGSVTVEYDFTKGFITTNHVNGEVTKRLF